MKRPAYVAPFLVVLAGAACSAAPTADNTEATSADEFECVGTDLVVRNAGGLAAASRFASFSFQATGTRWAPGEGYSPAEGPERTSTFVATVRHDLAGGKLRVDYERTLLTVGYGTKLVSSEIVAGDVGCVVGADSLLPRERPEMSSDRWASTVRQERLLNPQIVLRDVVRDPTLVTGVARERADGRRYEVVTIRDAVAPQRLWFDERSGRLAKLTTLVNDHLHRDTLLEARYERWEDSDGIPIPKVVSLALGGQMIHREERTAVQVNPALAADVFVFPADAQPQVDLLAEQSGARTPEFNQVHVGVGFLADGLQDFVYATEVAPGVHMLAGGSHNSLAVEQEHGVVLIDAPLHQWRGEALARWIDANLHKPVTYVVSSHFHDDHTGGLRTFVAAGATLVVGAPGAKYLQSSFAAPSTLEPDALARAPRAAVLQQVGVDQAITLPDRAHPVGVYFVRTTHASDMLIAIVGDVLFEADLFQPGLTPNPAYVQELRDALAHYGLAVASIAAAHGPPFTVPFDALPTVGQSP